jgi:hypothetical protein
MIIVKLQGGLGNQMFQYATAKAISIKSGDRLILDFSFYASKHENVLREPRINEFNIRNEYLNKIAHDLYLSNKYIFKLFRKVAYIKRVYIKEDKVFSFSEIKWSKQRNILLIDGYWQSENYFKDIQAYLVNVFTLQPTNQKLINILDDIIRYESVSIHIRRGDYISNKDTNQLHGICSIEYYKKAIMYIQDHCTKDLILYFFSDDIDWVRENISFGYKSTYINGFSDVEDMFLMKKCKHNIIANSSFSWWAAWLNESPCKIVVAPRYWLKSRDLDGNISSQIIPESWIKIENF